MTTGTAEGRYTLTFPEITDEHAVSTFLADLEQHMSTRGVPKLVATICKIQEHRRLVDKQLSEAQKTVDYINGVRHNAALGGKVRGLRNTGRKYFESLNTPALRVQAKFYGVDYDSYNAVEDIVNALVDKYVEEVVE